MGLFGKKKKRTWLDDKYTVRFELASKFDLKNNAAVKTALDQVSQSQTANNKTPLTQTLPFGTFDNIEAFFGELRKLAQDQPIEFAYFALWKFDKNEKTNPGKVGSGAGNPREFIAIENFAIDYRYQNLTKPVFEEIFNDPENDDVNYQDKVSLCQDIANFYKETCGVGDDEIARVPSMDESDRGAVVLDVPAYMGLSEQAPTKQNAVPVYDPSSSTFSTAQPAQQQNVSAEQAAIREKISNDKLATITPAATTTKATETTEQANVSVPEKAQTTVREKRATQRAVVDDVSAEQALARAKGHLEAPQFPVEELDPVDPGKHGYVEYQLNQKRKTYNLALQAAAQKISEHNEKTILQRREGYKKLALNQVHAFEKSHQEDNKKLFDQIEQETLSKKESALRQAEQEIDQKVKADLADAERAHQKQVEQITADGEANKHEANRRLTKKYEAEATQRFATEGKQLDKENFEALKKLQGALDRKYELKAREDANQLRIDGSTTLEKLFDDCNRQLDLFRTKVTNEHLNAKQTVIAEARAEAEKKRIEAPYDEMREKDKEVAALKEQLASAEATSKALKAANVDLQQRLNTKESQFNSLQHEHESLKTQQVAKQINANNQQSNENINDFLKLMMAQQLGGNPTNNESKWAEKVRIANEQAEQKLQAQNKKWRNTFVAAILIGLGLLGGITGYTVYQSHANSVRVSQINQQAKQRQTTAKQQSQSQLSPAETDKAALAALHANNLDQLNKHSTEKYYALDKAIIENDPKAVTSAVEAMGDNLQMNDRYRAEQAQSLLKQANYNSLAVKVAAAN